MSSHEFSASQAAGMRAAAHPSPVQVIAVSGGKGGVGKTCVSVNLATALAKAGKRVLVLDGDLSLATVDVLLGVTPRYTLEHVLNGQCTLEEAITETRQGFRIIPAASGVARLSELGAREHLGIVQAFSNLTTEVDVLIVDTAAGIADGVRQFCQAAQHVLVVLRDEPTSLTDAYALVKVLRRDHGMTHFRVLANMTQHPGDGETLFRKLERVTSRFLDVVVEYAGEIPEDPLVRQAIKEQRSVLDAFPSSPAAIAFRRLAKVTQSWPVATGPRGNLEFFVERLVAGPSQRLEPAP